MQFYCIPCDEQQTISDWWVEMHINAPAGIRAQICGYCPKGHRVKTFMRRMPLPAMMSELPEGRGYTLEGGDGDFDGDFGDTGIIAAAMETGFVAAHSAHIARRNASIVRLVQQVRRSGGGAAVNWKELGWIFDLTGSSAERIYRARPKQDD